MAAQVAPGTQVIVVQQQGAPPEATSKDADEPPPFAWLVNLVDPRFHNYNRPIMIAMLVGGGSMLFTLLLLFLQLTTDMFHVETTTTAIAYPQFYGGAGDQRRWYSKMTQARPAVTTSTGETTTTTTLCISIMRVPVPEGDQPAAQVGNTRWSKAMPFWENVAGSHGVNYMENCWPPEGFLKGQDPKHAPEPFNGATHPFAGGQWSGTDDQSVRMSLCPGVYNGYQLKAINDNPAKNGGKDYAWSGGDALMTFKNSMPAASQAELMRLVSCPPFHNSNGDVPWMVEYEQNTETKAVMKPTFGEAFGTALAYAAYIEVVLTAIFVNTLLLCGCLKQGKRVVPFWY